MDIQSLVHEWFQFAAQDLQAAKTLKRYQHPTPIEPICFHCQQSAEKYIKGFIALKGETPPRTHDLNDLAAICTSWSEQFNSIVVQQQLKFLTPFSVITRYPKGLDITEDHMTQAIKYAESIKHSIATLAKEHGYKPPKPPQLTI